MKNLYHNEFQLSHANVNQTLTEIRRSLKEKKYDSKLFLRIVFSAEEFFLKNIEAGNENNSASCQVVSAWGKLRLSASCAGNELAEEDESTRLNIIGALNLKPICLRIKNVNKITFALSTRKHSLLMWELGAFVASFVLGTAMRFYCSSETLTNCGSLLNMVCQKYTAIMVALAIPMIFFILVNSIARIGNSVAMRRKVLAVVGHAVFITLGGAILGLLMAIFVIFPEVITHSGVGGGKHITQLVMQSILQMFPDNLLSPLVNNNATQVAVLAIVLGIAMIFFKERSAPLLDLCDTVSMLLQRLLSWLYLALPGYIFLYTLSFILSLHDLKSLSVMVPLITLFYLGAILIFALGILYMYIISGCSPGRFFRGTQESLIVTLSTGSSSAGCIAAFDDFIKKMRLPPDSINFALPLSTIFCRPVVAYLLAIFLFYGAHLTGVQLSLSSIPVILLLTLISSVSTPSVAGGCIALFPILLGQFGIPLECMPMLVILYILTENFITMGSSFWGFIVTFIHSTPSLRPIWRRKKIEKTN